MGPHPAVAEIRCAVRNALAATSTSPTPVINRQLWSPGQPQLPVDHGTRRRVLVACSGGADSLALAAAVAFVAPRTGVIAGLITIDHGLQDGSDEQARRVAQLGYDLGLDPVEIAVVDVGREGGPEAAARTARYAALDAAADALDAYVLLGHTQDDQAETVLLGLGRGSGPRSIAGMRAAQGRYLRPLLGIRRAVTEAACAALGLEPWVDPHNADARFQRVRLRAEVVPLLEQILQGGVVEALARTAELLQEDLDALDELINIPPAAADGGSADIHQGELDVRALADQPRAIRARVLRLWAQQHGAGPLSAVHVRSMDELIKNWHGQGPLQLPGGVRVQGASGRLSVKQATPEEPFP
jgi:tRNA(Ile)-lysidine synthase